MKLQYGYDGLASPDSLSSSNPNRLALYLRHSSSPSKGPIQHRTLPDDLASKLRSRPGQGTFYIDTPDGNLDLEHRSIDKVPRGLSLDTPFRETIIFGDVIISSPRVVRQMFFRLGTQSMTVASILVLLILGTGLILYDSTINIGLSD